MSGQRKHGLAGRTLAQAIFVLEYGGSPVRVQQLVSLVSVDQGPLAAAAKIASALLSDKVALALKRSVDATARYPRSAWVYLVRGIALFDKGDLVAAEGALKRALKLSPSPGVLGHLWLGRVFLGMGRFQEAGEQAETIGMAHSRHPGLALFLGRVRLARCRSAGHCPCDALSKEDSVLLRVDLVSKEKGVDRYFLVGAGILLCQRGASGVAPLMSRLERKAFIGRPDLEELRARILLDLNRNQVALTKLVRLVGLYPQRASAVMALARGYFAVRAYPKALKTLSAVGQADRKVGWHLLYGRTLLVMGQYHQALKFVRFASKSYPNNLEMQLLLVRVLWKQGSVKEASRLVHRLFQQHPTDVAVLTTSAIMLAKQGAFIRAEARLREALAKDKDNPMIVFHLARVFVAEGKRVAARKLLERAEADWPDCLDCLLMLAKIEYDAGLFQSAIKRYRKVLHRNKKLVAAAVGLADVLTTEGKLDQADKVLDGVGAALRRAPWYLVKGRVALRRGRFASADRLLSKAGRAPDDGTLVAATVLAALSKRYQDKSGEAENLLDSLSGRLRRRPQVWVAWGLLWFARGKVRRAISRFRSALRACDHCPNRIKAEIEAYLGRALYFQGHTDAAWRHFRKAARLVPKGALTYHLQGVCFYEEEKNGRATQAFTRGLKLDAAYAPTFYYMGEIARSRGHRRKAVEWFRRYLKARPYGSLEAEARTSLRRLGR